MQARTVQPSVHEMPIDELRTRVAEAERILRVACRIAEHDLRNPTSAERAKERIASLCNDVSELLPGLAQPVAGPPAEAHVEEVDEEGGEGQEEEGDENEDDEWDVDYEKLRAAIDDPELMSRFPQGERDKFRAMAQQLLDAHDRHELYSRVTDGFQRLEETTRAGAEEARKQLAIALTMENLRKKRLD